MSLRRDLDLLFAVRECRIDIRSTAKLNTKQHLYRVCELMGKIHDRCVKANELRGKTGGFEYTTEIAIDPD